jgi:hypothetical protein
MYEYTVVILSKSAGSELHHATIATAGRATGIPRERLLGVSDCGDCERESVSTVSLSHD